VSVSGAKLPRAPSGGFHVIKLADYQNKYRYFKPDRTDDGILNIVFHTDGGPML
jgi:hypothetical protein